MFGFRCPECKQKGHTCDANQCAGNKSCLCKTNYHEFHELNTYCPKCKRWVLNIVRPEHSSLHHREVSYCVTCKTWETENQRSTVHKSKEKNDASRDRPVYYVASNEKWETYAQIKEHPNVQASLKDKSSHVRALEDDNPWIR